MGASGSVPFNPEEQSELKTKYEALKQEVTKRPIDIDTPRGVSAKEEVSRLRMLLKKTVEEDLAPRFEQGNEGGTNNQQGGEEEEESEDDGPDLRKACTQCGRKFNPDRIEKHESVCKGKGKKCEESSTTEATPSSSSDDKEKDNEKDKEVPKWKQDREKMKEQMKQNIDNLSGEEAEAAAAAAAETTEKVAA